MAFPRNVENMVSVAENIRSLTHPATPRLQRGVCCSAFVMQKYQQGFKCLKLNLYFKAKMSADNYFISDQNAAYFLTFTVTDWIDVFTRKEYKIEIVNSLNYCIKNKGLKIFAWCLMSNHVHLVCKANEGFRISDIIRDFKKITAKSIIKLICEIPESRKEWLLYRFEFAGKFDNRIKKYKFWQDTNHAVLLDSNEMIDQRINYTHEYPVRSLIVAEPQEYLFSSASDYAGEKGYVTVQTEF